MSISTNVMPKSKEEVLINLLGSSIRISDKNRNDCMDTVQFPTKLCEESHYDCKLKKLS